MRFLSRLLFTLILCATALFAANTLAQVERSQLTTDIRNREPVDDLGNQVILDNREIRLVFFTEIHNLQGKQVIHRWLFEGQEMASVPLSVGSPRWRTFSRKRILPSWRGAWQVQVWHDDLQLMSYDFVVE